MEKRERIERLAQTEEDKVLLARLYARQIGDYLALLRGMGYTETEGYVWYVALGRIERVE